MKKLYTLTVCLVAAITATAQQLPNAGFEEDWVDCVPWTFYQNEDNFGQQSANVVGQNPSGWVISHVSGMTTLYEGKPSGMGVTEVGSKVEGYNSKSAVELKNNPNPYMDAQIVPAYLSLGTPWSTAKATLDFSAGFNIIVSNSDGGSFGGVPFTGRPTGIEFMYKRSRGEDKPAEKSTVVAYLWKGHWTQKDVPSIIYMAGEPYLTDIVDRDRCVLGMDMTGCQGGEVTRTDDAELIAVINAEITEDASEWTKFSATFDYKSDATPEMFNIVIAAGDYFGGADVVGKDNTLVVDDVKLIYAEEPQSQEYAGNVTISIPGADPVVEASTIYIDMTGENTCTFRLPNFAFQGLPMGDIVVENVAISENNGVKTYTGAVEDLILHSSIIGDIHAGVTLNGTIDAQGNVNMNIPVIWYQDGDVTNTDPTNAIPIGVVFTNQKTPSGIEGIDADDNAPVEYYNLQGVRVANPETGIYIRRQGNKVSKVYVK